MPTIMQRLLTEFAIHATASEMPVIAPPETATGRQPYAVTSAHASGLTIIGIAYNNVPTKAVVPLDSSKYSTIDGNKTPKEYDHPSAMKNDKNDPINTTQPHPPSGAEACLLTASDTDNSEFIYNTSIADI